MWTGKRYVKTQPETSGGEPQTGPNGPQRHSGPLLSRPCEDRGLLLKSLGFGVLSHWPRKVPYPKFPNTGRKCTGTRAHQELRLGFLWSSGGQRVTPGQRSRDQGRGAGWQREKAGFGEKGPSREGTLEHGAHRQGQLLSTASPGQGKSIP